jgi:RNA polymerase sigma-70 factor (ECF subfamily)
VKEVSREPDTSPCLLERIAAGDASAVKACMDVYGGFVWTLARRYTRSVADAEDAAQEIFLELWKSAARYDPAMGKESTFIATIARRRLIDRMRAAGRQPATEEFNEFLTPGDAPPDEEAGAMAVDVAIAQRALAQLGAAEREVLLLGIVEGMTHSEIATATGRPIGTVKTQMRRGLIRLRQLVEQPEPDAGKGECEP